MLLNQCHTRIFRHGERCSQKPGYTCILRFAIEDFCKMIRYICYIVLIATAKMRARHMLLFLMINICA